MSKIIFFPINKTALYGMINLYDEASKRGHKCSLLLSNNLTVSSKYRSIFLESTDLVSNLLATKIIKLLPHFFTHKFRRIKNFLFHLFNKKDTGKIEKWVKDQIDKEKKIKTIFNDEMPDVIYTYGDRHGGYEPAIIKIANQKNIPVVVPPIAFFGGKEAMLISARKFKTVNNQFCVTNSFNFKNKYPNQWAYDKQTNNDYSYYPKWKVKAMDKLGVLPDNPWAIGGGNSDIVCTDGEMTKNALLKNGVKSNKIIITGNSEHDSLYNNWKNRYEKKKVIYQKYKFNQNKPLLTLALPQTYEHDLLSKNEHWKLQETICSNAAKSDWNLMISLHPKMIREDYIFLEKKYNLSIADERLRSILPVSDLFVAGQGSSTVLWSILCEVPAIILDWYGLNYSLYDWIKGIKIIRNENLFPKVIRELTSNDSKKRKEIKEKFKKQKHLVSKFDGKCTDRILSHKYLV